MQVYPPQPKRNRRWYQRKRAFKSGKEFENKVKEYINWCDSKGRLANVAGFAVYADINQDTFYAQKEYYSESFKKVNDMLLEIN